MPLPPAGTPHRSAIAPGRQGNIVPPSPVAPTHRPTSIGGTAIAGPVSQRGARRARAVDHGNSCHRRRGTAGSSQPRMSLAPDRRGVVAADRRRRPRSATGGPRPSRTTAFRPSRAVRRSARRRPLRRSPLSSSEVTAAAVALATQVGLREAGTVEFLLDTRRTGAPALLPGDEHPPPGGAPGHRAGRVGPGRPPRPRRAPAARRCRGGAGVLPGRRADRRTRDRGAGLRRGLLRRVPPAGGTAELVRWPRERGSTTPCRAARSSPRRTTRCWAR